MTATKKPQIYSGTGSAVDNYNKPEKQLKTILEGGRSHSKSNWGLFDKTNSQHKYVLSLLRQAQWVVPNERYGEVPDLARLSEFLKSEKSPVNKPLKSMFPEEISKIIIALEGIVKTVHSSKKR
ncbi:hypothetical protein GON26_01165 [Flavobacterium sp. GA093]|uniref:Uncharacterized protein n=1 Tax=Flavobacterium hydrocarbonoxydans TaxID=2683249 RepID=A0A6I4NMT5_9FLAO|nr:hypothetical protein [Flavobacterium hydrocarbonoxydans]MWB92959.1 hypothetical protein [Flavobacterium hydrocarbonoxydans]